MLIADYLNQSLQAGLSLPCVLAERASSSTEGMIFLERDGTTRSLSYAALYRRAQHMAARLTAAGVQPGDPVILIFDDEYRFVLSFWAVMLASGVAVPLSAPMSYTASDEALCKILAVYRQCIKQRGRESMVISDLEFDSLARVTAWIETIPPGHFVASAYLLRGLDEIDAVLEDLDGRLPIAQVDDLAILMFSSGSTGDPKGVRLTHRQILFNLVQLGERSDLSTDDRSLSWLPLTHDMGLILFHLCHTLAGIAQYKMTPLTFARDPGYYLDQVSAYRISLLGMPNFGFDQLLRAAADVPAERWPLSSVRLIYNGAEPIDPNLCRRFMQRFKMFGLGKGVISPGWGIAEASVAATEFPVSRLAQYDDLPTLWIAGKEAMTPGQPIQVCAPSTPHAYEIAALGPLMSGMRIRVLDDEGQELPPSCLGHLEIKGPNVSRGYFNGPDTEWCAAGDIGFVHEGIVYITGRAKDVIFINGRNHFSNDLETALCQTLDWPANQLAVVGVTDPVKRIEQVVVFFRRHREAERSESAERIRRALETLLAYPVAGAIGLSALPKTTSGKIRRFVLRQALARGDYESALANGESRPARPLSQEENALAALIREIVPGLPVEIDPDLPLSRYGLDSVGFMQLAFRAGTRSGRAVTPQTLIRAGSLAAVAAAVETAGAAVAPVALQRGRKVPLSSSQAMLWTAWLLDPAGAAYNESYWLKLDGRLEAGAWLAAARQVIARHPMLNAVVDDCWPPTLTLQDAAPADVDLLRCDEADAGAAMERLASQAFDLRRGPLLRMRLIDTGAGHIVFLSAHHIVVDGWSIHLLISQIFAVYAGAALPPAESELWFQPARFDAARIETWRERIKAADAVQLPAEADHGGTGQTVQYLQTLTPSASRAVRDWQLAHGSEFTALAGALSALLARLAGISRPLLGTVISGRYDQAAEQRVGYFAATVPLIAEIDPEAGFEALTAVLDRQRLAMLDGEVPDLPALENRTVASLAESIRVVYVHQNMPAIALPAGLAAVTQGQYRGSARTDLYVSSGWQADRLCLNWEYDSARFGTVQIAAYAELFEYVLTQLLAAPERPLANLDLLSPVQRVLWKPYQDTALAVDFERSVVARFEAAAQAWPKLPALSDYAVRYRYGELSKRVDALCWRLEDEGLERGDRVCLLTERSADYVVALLACLKMAAVVVPIDPALPADRIALIAGDSAAALLLTTPGVELPEAVLAGKRCLCFRAETLGATAPHPGRAVSSDDPAYLIFTSGSTGQPKGVLNTHRCLANLVEWVCRSFAYQAGETICQFAPFSFDVSIAEILPSLCAGLHIHVLPAERRNSPDLYLDTLREHRVNVATVTPAYFAMLNEVPQHCRTSLGALRLMILGGEALKTEEVRRFREHSPHVAIVNVYGPTETTVLSTAYPVPQELARDQTWQPLGQPIANTELWLLDEAGRVCPATVAGTIYIGGDGLSQGYWQDAAKTAAAFRMLSPDGQAPRRFYCSGDLARLSSTGWLEFIGRADNQIKLRGFRIELGEIEAALEQLPQLQAAVVKAVAREGGERVLAAYYSGERQERSRLDGFLRQRLPSYMVPAVYHHIEDWPLTANRKVDRNRLPEPDWLGGSEEAGYQPPQGDTECRLAAIWTELLGMPRIGRQDHFFLLGGSSLGAVQLVNRIREQFQRALALTAVMRCPTLEQMARCVEQAAADSRPEPTRRGAGTAQVPATEAQARMFFLDRAHPGSPLNNIPLTLALGSTLDADRLRDAIAGVTERHSILRGRFRLDDQGVVLSFDAACTELETLTAPTFAEAIELARHFHSRAYALEQGPLWRVALVRADDSGREWLALSMHHAIADGVTVVRVLTELDVLYQGLGLAPVEGELSYADYALWQRDLLNGDFGAQAGRFWAEERHHRPLPQLPEAQGGRGSVGGRQFTVDLDAGQTAILRKLCGTHRVSPFVLMLSLFGFVIGQRCRSNRFALGVTFSGRSRLALEKLAGLFVNTVPLAFDWAPEERFADLVARVKTGLTELQEFEDYPLNRVMSAQKLRDMPFNVLFNEEVLPARLGFGGVPAALEAVSVGIAKFPLLVSFLFDEGCWRWRMEYREPGLSPTWVVGLLNDVMRLIKALDGMNEARLGELEAPDEDLLALLDSN